MNVFEYYWHRTSCLASDVKTGVSEFCHWTTDKALSNETIIFQATQFIEGFKTVATFPFTSAKMIFDKPSRTLAAHVLQYNVLYYMVPVVAYNGFLREHVKTLLANTCGDYIFYMDLLANAVFTRALINAYAVNIFNNMNASSIALPNTPSSITLSCSCKESRHMKGALMSPVYYLSKVAVLTPLEHMPYIGPVIRYTLKPLAWGEALNEVNLSSLCHDHRAEYFATHNPAHYGMGMAVLASTQIASTAMTYYTGASGFFIQDAIFNALYPFVIFHVHNQQFGNVFIADTPKDIFRPLRHQVEQSLLFDKDYMATLKQTDNSLLEQLLLITRKLKLRDALIYRSLGQTPEQLVTFPPLRMLLNNNQFAIQEKLDAIKMVTDHPNVIGNFLFLYQWLPLLPAKEHTRIMVDIMTDNMDITTTLLAHAQRLVRHAESYNENAELPAQVRFYSREGPNSMKIEEYIAEPAHTNNLEEEYIDKPDHTNSSTNSEIETLSARIEKIQLEPIADDWEFVSAPSSPSILHARQASTSSSPVAMSMQQLNFINDYDPIRKRKRIN
jgi:hypothetical protein